ncbi:hypothetical protein LIA77_03068 [Sarocladium implicatum]|nr:hypothetical protein LIA77_03068 [Sarocladium implicatum]
MLFGGNAANASEALSQQKSSYLVPPNFSIKPASATTKGPLDLGTLVTDLGRYRPVNQGVDNRVPIPEDLLYVDVIEDVSFSSTASRGIEGGLFAKILDQSIGGDASLKGKRSSEDVFTMDRLETRYFYPNMAYVRKASNLPDVREFNEMCEHKEPLYLITGLKIAWGAKISTSRGSELEGKLEGGASAPAGVVDLGVGGNAGLSSASGVTFSHGKPRDFVLGIQLEKIRYKKKSLFGKPELTMEEVKPKGKLVEVEHYSMIEHVDDDDFEAEVEGLDEVELSGMQLVKGTGPNGEEESWLIPAEV